MGLSLVNFSGSFRVRKEFEKVDLNRLIKVISGEGYEVKRAGKNLLRMILADQWEGDDSQFLLNDATYCCDYVFEREDDREVIVTDLDKGEWCKHYRVVHIS